MDNVRHPSKGEIMRIAMVTDSYYPTRDGVVTSITTIKNALESLGHEVFVIAPDPGREFHQKGVRYFPAIEFKRYKGYYVPIFPSNKIDIMKDLDVDVIHIHGIAVMALKGMICAHTLKVPAVITFHTLVGDTMKYYSPVPMPDDISERLVWTYLRNILKRADAVISPTESTASELKSKGVCARDLRVIPTGIDIRRFVPGIDGSELKKKYDLEGKKVIVCVGRVSYEKEIDVLIKSMVDIDDAVLMIIGKGPATDDLKELVTKLKVDKKVIFTGFVQDSELVQFYGIADVSASASRFETQGLSILEAMSCGLPVVCTNARALADFVKNDDNGYLFDGSSEDCSRAIRKALCAEEAIGRNARKTAEQFSIELCVAKTVSLYEDVIVAKKKRLGE
ncbi:MAG: glycosyltransferase [Candidatus Methanomethylophilaceae archaeon]|jgi:1,2-diacylglycerol 3-alpha-glucosyltransferase